MKQALRRARADVLVVGVGSPIRQDDGVGHEMVRLLAQRFPGGLSSEVLFEPDIGFAETVSRFAELIVLDAWDFDGPEPYRVVDLVPSASCAPVQSFVSHVFDWELILAVARDVFGHVPKARLVGVRASAFEYAEQVTPACMLRAGEALEFVERCLSLFGSGAEVG